MIGSVIGHTIERNLTNKALDSKEGKGILNEARVTGEGLISGIHTWMIIVGSIIIVGCLVAYSIAGKGTGSHAGREEIRRSYRRKLAQEMAKQDAEMIKKGEKPRRKWMQW